MQVKRAKDAKHMVEIAFFGQHRHTLQLPPWKSLMAGVNFGARPLKLGGGVNFFRRLQHHLENEGNKKRFLSGPRLDRTLGVHLA